METQSNKVTLIKLPQLKNLKTLYTINKIQGFKMWIYKYWNCVCKKSGINVLVSIVYSIIKFKLRDEETVILIKICLVGKRGEKDLKPGTREMLPETLQVCPMSGMDKNSSFSTTSCHNRHFSCIARGWHKFLLLELQYINYGRHHA